MEEQNQEEIDLQELVIILFKRWYIIVASVLLVFSATFVYAFLHLEDDFTASRVYTVSVEDPDLSTAARHSLAERLVSSHVDFATSKVVLDELRVNLANSGVTQTYSDAQLRSMITVSPRGSNSIALLLSVESKDAELSALIANELYNVIDDLTSSEEITSLATIDSWGIAEVPTSPSGPNRILYVTIGIILGGMIGVFTVFIIEFLDKSIKSSKDIERHLDLRVLGVIPEYNMGEVEDDEA